MWREEKTALGVEQVQAVTLALFSSLGVEQKFRL